MQRYYLAFLLPPVSVCRYGCAGCCAAPITVFWLAGIASLIYGFLGGPLGLEGISWNTVGLGAVLWGIAATWAIITVHNVNDDLCQKKASPICSKISNQIDESDPLDEIHKAQ